MHLAFFVRPTRSSATRLSGLCVRTKRQYAVAIMPNTSLLSRTHSINFLTVLLALTGFLGCGGKDRDASESPTANPTLSKNDVDLDSQFVGTVTSLPADDPAKQGWPTEVVASVAGKQLKSLTKALITGKPIDPSALADHVTDDFRGTAIRPQGLEVVYDGTALVVRRQASGNSNSNAEYEGPAGLARGLNELVSVIGNVQNAHEKFKIFRVETVAPSETLTDAYFQFGARTSSGTFQVNATWRCRWKTGKQIELKSIEVLDYEETVGRASGPMFADCTESVLDGTVFRDQLALGVDHWLSSVEMRHGIDIGGWQGIAVGDANGDSLDDLYICQPGGLPNRLYIQNEDGTCKEASAPAGVDFLDSTHGSLFVDLDNDGDQDLLVSMGDGVLILSNNGNGTFRPRAPMITPSGTPYSLAASDYDNDGDLDIFVCCYNARKGVAQHILFARPVPYHDANNGARNVLLKNDATPSDGPWRFDYATHSSGITENNTRFSYAAAWEDFDDDGDQDIYIANDFGRNNLLRNDNGRFTDIAPSANAEDISPGMSACWGDYDNDGRMDLYVSNMFSSAGNRITFQDQFMGSVESATKSQFQRHARGNTLLRNVGDGSFADVSVPGAVTLGRWAWGSRFFDANNDGRQDLLVTNGFVTQEDTGDL